VLEELPQQEGAVVTAPVSITREDFRSLAPLPDNALPLAEQLPALLRRATLGDPVASCRLILSITRCKQERWSQQFAQRAITALEARKGRNDGLLVGLVAQSQENLEKSGAYCDGVDPASLPRSDELLSKSMHALTPHQKTILAMLQSDGTLRRVNDRRSFSESELFIIPQFMADHTVDFLMEGYTARDPLALEGLVLLHAPGSALDRGGMSVWLPNPRLFLQYAMLTYELFGPEALGTSGVMLLNVTSSTVSASELDSITRNVQSEVQRWRRAAGFQASAANRLSKMESEIGAADCTN